MAKTTVANRQLTDFNVTAGEFTGDGEAATPFSLGVVPVTKGGTGAIANTGSGVNVLSTSPTLVTPVIGAATGVSLNLSGLTASNVVVTDASKNLASQATSGSGNIARVTSPTFVTPTLGAAVATTPTSKDNTTKVATTAFVAKQFTAVASGTGAAVTISIPHAVSGITTSSSVMVTANSIAASGFSYVTVDTTNVNIVYGTAPPSGTNNLMYSISIK